MDLIYTNTNREDVGVLNDYTFDLAFGSDENDFELTLDVNNHCCEPNCIVYMENTEYGGIIDKINITTRDDKLVYKGRTWHGILATKVIAPDTGKAYFTVSGEANSVINTVIQRVGLTELFGVSEEHSGLTINEYSFNRFCDAYSGLVKMLTTASGKLHLSFNNGKVFLSALPIVDYSQDEQFDSDQIEMTIEKTDNAVNHLICLGKGELAERQVIHLYVDDKGNISKTQTFTGLQEVTGVYDNSNAESLEELEQLGTDKLKESATKDKVQMDFDAEQVTYDIGDIVGAKEILTGIFAKEKITKKIVTITQGLVNIQYKVGE